MSKFLNPYPDFAEIESLFSPEQKQVQALVRNFVQKEVEPLIQEACRKEEFPISIISKMGSLGLLGSFLSGYGLSGMDTMSYGLIMKELERCDSGVRSSASCKGPL